MHINFLCMSFVVLSLIYKTSKQVLSSIINNNLHRPVPNFLIHIANKKKWKIDMTILNLVLCCIMTLHSTQTPAHHWLTFSQWSQISLVTSLIIYTIIRVCLYIGSMVFPLHAPEFCHFIQSQHTTVGARQRSKENLEKEVKWNTAAHQVCGWKVHYSIKGSQDQKKKKKREGKD